MDRSCQVSMASRVPGRVAATVKPRASWSARVPLKVWVGAGRGRQRGRVGVPQPPPCCASPPLPRRARTPPPPRPGAKMRMVCLPALLGGPRRAGVGAARGRGRALRARASARRASNRSMTLGGNLSGLSVRSLIWETASRNFAWPPPRGPSPDLRDAEVQIGLREVARRARIAGGGARGRRGDDGRIVVAVSTWRMPRSTSASEVTACASAKGTPERLAAEGEGERLTQHISSWKERRREYAARPPGRQRGRRARPRSALETRWVARTTRAASSAHARPWDRETDRIPSPPERRHGQATIAVTRSETSP